LVAYDKIELIDERFCIRPLKKAVNTWSTEKDINSLFNYQM